MAPQITKQVFIKALAEMGHDPADYDGKKLSLTGMCELYGIDQDIVLEAIDLNHLDAHYDYRSDTIWVDALEAAHFFYCISTEAQLYSANQSSETAR